MQSHRLHRLVVFGYLSTILPPSINVCLPRTPHHAVCHLVFFQVNDLLMEAEAIVRDTLSPFVKQEMVDAFDDLW